MCLTHRAILTDDSEIYSSKWMSEAGGAPPSLAGCQALVEAAATTSGMGTLPPHNCMASCTVTETAPRCPAPTHTCATQPTTY